MTILVKMKSKLLIKSITMWQPDNPELNTRLTRWISHWIQWYKSILSHSASDMRHVNCVVYGVCKKTFFLFQKIVDWSDKKIGKWIVVMKLVYISNETSKGLLKRTKVLLSAWMIKFPLVLHLTNLYKFTVDRTIEVNRHVTTDKAYRCWWSMRRQTRI